MQRYSSGVKVPNFKIDVFTGKTTTASGYITCVLTYVPHSLNDILIGSAMTRKISKISLTGKDLLLRVYRLIYDKTDTPTAVDVGSAGAGANHSHGLAYTPTSVDFYLALNELQNPITVHYTVKG